MCIFSPFWGMVLVVQQMVTAFKVKPSPLLCRSTIYCTYFLKPRKMRSSSFLPLNVKLAFDTFTRLQPSWRSPSTSGPVGATPLQVSMLQRPEAFLQVGLCSNYREHGTCTSIAIRTFIVLLSASYTMAVKIFHYSEYIVCNESSLLVIVFYLGIQGIQFRD